ncbi:MAG: DNA polymerase III subunit alpha [Actinobacteria bacterium]|nr:DNA polymerase III subunit alpha [Actinomycetota bacterium]
MSEPGDFAHLHVASGYSLRHGAATPQDLVDRAVAHDQGVLALTDRDGLYGAIRFATAAMRAGITPVLGVDLAVAGPGVRGARGVGGGLGASGTAYGGKAGPRTPVRGGALVDPRHPRVTVLARGQGAGLEPAAGWSALCRLVTDTHLTGERGTPICTPELLARWSTASPTPTTPSPTVESRRHAVSGQVHAARPLLSTVSGEGPARLRVLLGPDSDVGRALLHRRPETARDLLARWLRLLPPDALAIEVVLHGGPDGTTGCLRQARGLLGLADEAGLPAILSGAVRHLEREDAVVADVLDAARRLVVLDTRHLDRVTDAGHLADTATMTARARAIAGPDDTARAHRLLTDTLALAAECALDGRADLGIGAVHLPEQEVLGIPTGEDPHRVLAERCRGAVSRRYPSANEALRQRVESRLEDELAVIAALGYPTYFLTVAEVTDLIRAKGVRVAARGSGAGSLVNHLLGISGVDPIRHDLLMERFCTTLRAELPDIDVDVESARRTEIYEAILERFSGERVTCVSMMDTYKVRHAIRDVGAALGMPPAEVDEIAKAFPHIRAKDVRHAIADLPELRGLTSHRLTDARLTTLFDLVERLDGLPRHIALHPCGVVLSNAGLLDRTPVEASWIGFPMSQFDKDDVETLGLLKLDVLGIRMQSAMAHALTEIERVEGKQVDLDDEAQVPHDDPATFALIRTTRTLGCFQIESPGQRELIGKFGPERFGDLIIDISLFRPGPVKSDMITPFLESRHGWRRRRFLHPSLVPALAETEGVVVFHEQVLQIVAETTGVSLAQADEVRRTMGTPQGQEDIEAWWRPAAKARGYTATERDEIWAVLKSFASFGFCKAHAAAFALPTFHSAWLKTHHPAAFLAGVLTHDPGMYPKRLILDDARSLGIAVLGLDVNASRDSYRLEALTDDEIDHDFVPIHPDLPDGRRHGIRLSLTEVKGISEAEVAAIVAGQPFADLADFWSRTHVSRPIVERLVLAGGFDAMYGLGGRGAGLGRRGKLTRRDLLLHVAEIDRWHRSLTRSGGRRRATAPRVGAGRPVRATPDRAQIGPAGPVGAQPHGIPSPYAVGTRERAAAQSQAAATVVPAEERSVQLLLDLGDRPELREGSGLPELTGTERVRAELDVLGLDASSHVIDTYRPLLDVLGVTPAQHLLRARNGGEVWVAGVKVATQTPPIRSGRRVVFLTLDDGTGCADATFFEDVQGPYAETVFHSWLLLVRGVVRRTGERGISLRATGAWELSTLWEAWQRGGQEAVHAALLDLDRDSRERAREGEESADASGRRRVLVHASGFRQSPYADTRPPGTPTRDLRGLTAAMGDQAPRKLWHSSPGSSGH